MFGLQDNRKEELKMSSDMLVLEKKRFNMALVIKLKILNLKFKSIPISCF